MKKYFALLFVLLLLLFCGCSENTSETSEEKNRTDYVINTNDEINIGVIAPYTNGDSVAKDVVDGVKFANEMASGVNIDKRYNITLSVYNSEENCNKTAKDLIDKNVSAVICYTSDYTKTNSIIEAFSESTTPLLFVDNCSDKISENSTSLSLASSDTYKASVLASFISSEGYKNGAIVYEDNEYYKEFSDSFVTLLSDNYGVDSSVFAYTDDADLKTIINGKDFVFVAGNNSFSTTVSKSVKGISSDIPVVLTEIYRTQDFADVVYNNTYFLSKFEVDDNNHYIIDFRNVYSNVKGVSKDQISSAVAYGYDAYMLIYGALGSLNPNSGASLLGSVKNDSDETETSITINASQVYDAIVKDTKVYGGPIDTIVFDENGMLKPSYIFIDGVENGSPYMINKFVY